MLIRILNERPNICVDGHHHPQESKIAYCWSDEHRGYLTPRLMKQHDCLNKQCKSFQKLDHPYWREAERKKASEGERYRRRAEQKLQDDEYLALARESIKERTDIYFTSAKLVRKGLIKITYIGNRSFDLSELASSIRDKTQCGVWWRYVHTDIETLKTLGLII